MSVLQNSLFCPRSPRGSGKCYGRHGRRSWLQCPMGASCCSLRCAHGSLCGFGLLDACEIMWALCFPCYRYLRALCFKMLASKSEHRFIASQQFSLCGFGGVGSGWSVGCGRGGVSVQNRHIGLGSFLFQHWEKSSGCQKNIGRKSANDLTILDLPTNSISFFFIKCKTIWDILLLQVQV
jgi:hypothetical protein